MRCYCQSAYTACFQQFELPVWPPDAARCRQVEESSNSVICSTAELRSILTTSRCPRRHASNSGVSFSQLSLQAAQRSLSNRRRNMSALPSRHTSCIGVSIFQFSAATIAGRSLRIAATKLRWPNRAARCNGVCRDWTVT